MAVVKPFRAVRPMPEYAQQVAALPYDVMSSDEAREMVVGKPWSFLHVDRGEIDLPPGTSPYDAQVYEKARQNLENMLVQGVLKQDEAPCFYIYALNMDGRSQVGLVACCDIDDYMTDVIKKHELTRADKEEDRIRHVDTLDANTGPIFLTYDTARDRSDVAGELDRWAMEHEPVYNFTCADGVGHVVWVVDDVEVMARLEAAFAGMDSLYIADGHHRCASAVQVGQRRRRRAPGYTGEEEFNRFLSVIFPDSQLRIFDYNRVAADLNGLSPEAFLEKLDKDFEVELYTGAGPLRPSEKHSFGMYLDGRWYMLAAKPGTFNDCDPVERLDVSVLQGRVLAPLLGIEDPRTDKRIDFVGGIRGLGELEARVDGGMAVAFAMVPTTLDELMAIADAGMVMPPKSTWFEPKLRSGLFIHKLND